MNPHIRISLVVATYNRSAALVELLRSVAAQRLDPALWECVVVDNRSTDDTAARFEAFSREHPDLPLRRIYEPKQGSPTPGMPASPPAGAKSSPSSTTTSGSTPIS